MHDDNDIDNPTECPSTTWIITRKLTNSPKVCERLLCRRCMDVSI